MRLLVTIVCFLVVAVCITPLRSTAQTESPISLYFLQDTIVFNFSKDNFVDFSGPLSESSIRTFYWQAEEKGYQAIAAELKKYKAARNLDDWFYYQLIRKAAQALSPKASNYQRYTLYKWFFLRASGYDAIVTIKGEKILLYVRSDETVYNIPYRETEGKKYICLNYHDYGFIDFEKEKFTQAATDLPAASGEFSYAVTNVPESDDKHYIEKNIEFTYYHNRYQFQVKLNPEVRNFFTNYPVVDYEKQFNMPLSRKTYESLLNSIKPNLKNLTQKEGIDFLMHFTRYAFLFKKDNEVFGAEKRLSPEQTLLYDYSDCEDRAALFFFLVKEIYDLPMLVLVYPDHVTVAVHFKKPFGTTIEYNGLKYSICEPSPQKKQLRVGQIMPELKTQPYQIAYAYNPSYKK